MADSPTDPNKEVGSVQPPKPTKDSAPTGIGSDVTPQTPAAPPPVLEPEPTPPASPATVDPNPAAPDPVTEGQPAGSQSLDPPAPSAPTNQPLTIPEEKPVETTPPAAPLADPPPVPEPEPTPPPSPATPGPLPPEAPSEAKPAAQSEDMGPPWLRTNPKVRDAQDGATSVPSLSPTPPSAETPPPWQVPSDKPANIQPNVYAAGEEKRGGFPIIIFVILVLGIIAAVIAYFIIK